MYLYIMSEKLVHLPVLGRSFRDVEWKVKEDLSPFGTRSKISFWSGDWDFCTSHIVPIKFQGPPYNGENKNKLLLQLRFKNYQI